MNKKITIDNKTIIYREHHKNILECLESEDIEVHYHCRDGFCGACRITLNSGNIHYPEGEPLAFVADGEILTCCCIPSDDINITLE